MDMGMTAIASMAIGSATSAVGSIMSGREKSAAAQFESQQYQQQADAARTAAMQDETQRRRQLTSGLETIQALRAGRGVGATSPTAMAIYNTGVNQSEDDIQASRANYTQKADLASRAAYLSERRASSSLLAGYMGAASSIAGAGFKYGSLAGSLPNATVFDLMRTDMNNGPIRSPF